MVVENSQFAYRNNEKSTGLFDRSGRFFCRKGSWFFKTREDIDYGPFQNRVECRYAYNEFIEVVSDSSKMSTESFDYQDINSNWRAPKINFS
ncbi:MAG: hypothetical protein KUG78_04970 [Kangiellaceae bacterium]|nr:hypothetical protein [Kangiellaceae bacterium]